MVDGMLVMLDFIRLGGDEITVVVVPNSLNINVTSLRSIVSFTGQGYLTTSSSEPR